MKAICFVLLAISELVRALKLANFQRDLVAIEHELQSSLHTAPEIAIAMLILAEDRRFARHRGVDPIALVRIPYLWFTKGKLHGGSTIEQQLVRTITQRYEKTVRRKIRELLLASQLEKFANKQEIAACYLQVAYFGFHPNGLAAACKKLNFDLNRLSPNQAALLAARLKYPVGSRFERKRLMRLNSRATRLVQLFGESRGGRMRPLPSSPII